MKAINPKGPSEGEYRAYRGVAFYCVDSEDTTAQYGEFAEPGDEGPISFRVACNRRKE